MSNLDSKKVRISDTDPNKTFFRSKRFFQCNGQWYFSTRESEDVGPFNGQKQAEEGLKRYLKYLGAKKKCNVNNAVFVAKGGFWDHSARYDRY